MVAFDVDSVRARFSALGGSFAFFDAPGGTQVPDEVGSAIAEAMKVASGNVGAPYATSKRIEELAGDARSLAAEFAGCRPEEVIFGANMTSLNFTLSRTAARSFSAGDEILVTRLDHDANVAPWLNLAEDQGLIVRQVDILPDTTLDLADLERKLTSRTRVVAFPWAANSVGTITDAARVTELAHSAGALAWIDAVQYAPHLPMDSAAIDADIVIFSAYKFCGPHLGIAYGRREVLESWAPYKARPVPTTPAGRQFETGSLPSESLAGFNATMRYLASIGGISAVAEWERVLGERFLAGLPEQATLYGMPTMAGRIPIFLCTFAGVPSARLSAELADNGFGVWSGTDYYSLGLYERLSWGEALRVGISHYNTIDEVDRLTAALASALQAGPPATATAGRPDAQTRPETAAEQQEDLAPGDRFPIELLPDEVRDGDGSLLRPTVVYFYPKDGTPTCTRQAVEFGRHAGRFEQAGLTLIGVSADSAESHREFARAHELPFALISDTDLRLSRTAGVTQDFGEHGTLAGRVTFLLDRRGTVRRAWAVEDVSAHPGEVLAAAATLSGGS